MKNVWLKDDTEALHKKARLIYVKETEDIKVTDDKVIKEALRWYVHGIRRNDTAKRT